MWGLASSNNNTVRGDRLSRASPLVAGVCVEKSERGNIGPGTIKVRWSQPLTKSE